MSLVARLAAADLDWLVPAWSAPANVHGLMTTRRGGVCEGANASLDLGPAHFATLDSGTRAAFVENRRRVEAFLPSPPVWLEQVHGIDVARVDAANVSTLRASPPRADAAVTRLADVPFAIRVADCLPVLFADDDGEVVAAAHAGWRGLAAGVLEATIAAMEVPPRTLVAWLGPAIGAHAFEVGADVRDAFCDRDRRAPPHFVRCGDRKWLADLPALARQRLSACGITRLAGESPCTHSDPKRFFSYRRDRSSGRMGALVWRTARP